MKHNKQYVLMLGAILTGTAYSVAQTYSASSNMEVHPKADIVVPFKLSEKGVIRSVEWGADLAWLSEENLRRCLAFMGKDNVEIVRTSFQPTYQLVDGDLQQAQKDTLQQRIDLLKYCNPTIKLTINCDHPHVDSWYRLNADHWAQLIDTTTAYYQKAGYKVVSVSPFNEPDYGWNQWLPGSQDANETNRMKGFAAVAKALHAMSRFDSIRICGGNTLNCDRALPWYNYLKDQLDEGNTHQLAGTFDNFASFYTTLANDGKHATADEMHNVGEAMVGLEYGMQTGIWWGAAERARGEFCKASHGERLAYAEHRSNWTAASVYRAPDGKVQAFGGTSERQGVATSYRLLSKERDVFFDGHGPQREYVMQLPGGTGYQTGQTNAEQVIDITWGDDVQPVVDGTYLLLNKSNNQVLDIKNGNLYFTYYVKSKTTQQWKVNPVDSRVGNDFSYHQLLSASNNQTLDVLNFSLDDRASVILYANSKNTNQQWYLEYEGDGWFRIRNRHSSLCLAINGNSIVQREIADNKAQLWRLLPTDVLPRIRTINDIPTNVVAEARPSSVLLTWNKTNATTPTYTVLRSDNEDGDYCIIARDVDDTAFVDNKVKGGYTYYYKVKTVDISLNSSKPSDAVAATPTGARDLIAHYEFEDNANDTTLNLNHAAVTTTAEYAAGKTGYRALNLQTTGDYAQLPADVADYEQMTVAAWINWAGGNSWQRIFDFGNSENEYMFLTPNANNGKLRFAIKNNGDEQTLDGESMTSYRNKWVHVAVTMGDNGVTMYVDGKKVASSTAITLRPTDIHPLLNYIGHSQFEADPDLKGCIDDVRIYNYALTADEISQLYGVTSGVTQITSYSEPTTYSVYDMQGKLVETTTTQPTMAQLPDGVYIVKAQADKETNVHKVVVKR